MLKHVLLPLLPIEFEYLNNRNTNKHEIVHVNTCQSFLSGSRVCRAFTLMPESTLPPLHSQPLSTAMSPNVLSNDPFSGAVISQARRNPKNPRQQAAQIIFVSRLADVFAHTPFNRLSRGGVMVASSSNHRLSQTPPASRPSPYNPNVAYASRETDRESPTLFGGNGRPTNRSLWCDALHPRWHKLA